jgi:arginyl-tRNA synthetase
MRTITAQLDEHFRTAIRSAFGFDADPLIGPAQNEKFGDYQANAAMGLAKQVSEKTGQKTNPRAVAEQIKARLDLGGMAEDVSIAGPGFINVRLSPEWLAGQLQAIAADPRLGVEKVGEPKNVVVDYSGPNIAKELHVGHLRSTIIGDAVSRIIEFQGHNVIRQNHVGDWGTQFGMLITHLRASGAGRDSHIEDLENFYIQAKRRFDEDADFADEARRTVVRLQGGQAEERELWKRIVDETRRHYQPVYGRLGVKLKPEHERGESFYNPMLADVVRTLREKQVARESEGAVAVFVEGYENPLLIEKSGGGYLYGTTDLAAIRYRVEQLHASRIIYFVDARQSQHFAQVFAAARKAGWAEGVSLEHAAFGTMLGPDGKPFKTRTGGVVKLAELLDEAEERAYQLVTEKNPDVPEARRREIAHAVGIGGVKYSDLSKDRTSDYVFSFDAILSLDGNTAPYMQYAHARVRSIFRMAAKRGIQYAGAAGSTIRLESPYEIALAKQILRLGEVIEVVGRELKPHHLCTYLYELATRFSGFFENCPVIQSEEPTRTSRLALVELTATTIARGLDLLGIEHPDQM